VLQRRFFINILPVIDFAGFFVCCFRTFVLILSFGRRLRRPSKNTGLGDHRGRIYIRPYMLIKITQTI